MSSYIISRCLAGPDSVLPQVRWCDLDLHDWGEGKVVKGWERGDVTYHDPRTERMWEVISVHFTDHTFERFVALFD